MQGTPLSAADQAEIDKRLNYMEAKDIAITADSVIEMCFRECVNNFFTKDLDKKEKECIANCSGRYMGMVRRIYDRYQELRTLQEQE